MRQRIKRLEIRRHAPRPATRITQIVIEHRDDAGHIISTELHLLRPADTKG